MKLAVVAIGGPHGSGKSSIAKKIANEFNMTYLSAGEVFRKLAKEKNYTIEEFTNYALTHSEIDKEIDNIIFLDCGSNSQDVINHLKTKKIKSIIIDHHIINDLDQPKSDILINPTKNNQKFIEYNVCAATLTFFLVDLINKKLDSLSSSLNKNKSNSVYELTLNLEKTHELYLQDVGNQDGDIIQISSPNFKKNISKTYDIK